MKPAILIALTSVALVTGCGVPTEDEPRPIGQSVSTVQPSASSDATATGPVAERLYFVKDEQLVAVERRRPDEPDVTRLIADLLAGPTEQENTAGLSSALLGSNVVVSVEVNATVATVELAAQLEGTGRNDDRLAVGQLVCTLTSRSDITQVLFTRGGVGIQVPGPDGGLTQQPLSAADYSGLIGIL